MECYSDNEGEIILMDFTFENALNIFTGGPSNISGRVGVCHNGVYDSVCDVNWDNNDASVMCRILGINASKFTQRHTTLAIHYYTNATYPVI